MNRYSALLLFVTCVRCLLAQDTVVAYYPDGKQKDVELFVNGKREGRCLYYYQNQRLSSIEHYHSDSLVSFTLFHPDGSRDTTTASPNSGGFPGGWSVFRKYLTENINYPPRVLIDQIRGKCYAEFTVDTTGMVKNVRILRGVRDCLECDREIRRLLEEMPQWIPIRRHNRTDKATLQIPIMFNTL